MAEVEMPQLGETVTEGTIIRWFKQVGETVAVDEVLFEVSTDKVDSEVPSPIGGVLTEILVPEGDTVDVGTVLAMIGAPAPAPQNDVAAGVPESASTPARPDEARLLSPVVRRLIRENNLDASAIVGTGVGGRITRKDVLDLLDTGAGSRPAAVSPPEPPLVEPKEAAAVSPPEPPLVEPKEAAPAAEAPAAQAPSTAVPVASTEVDTVEQSHYVPFNNVRRRTGEHMVHSVAVSPHAMTVMEIDYEGVDQVRSLHKATFKAQEGFSLTFLPFIIRAVVDALADWPYMNASVEGEGLRVHHDLNIGVAVDLDNEGLVVPVLSHADGLRLRAVARQVNDLATRARTKQLGVNDITGGTFTISNNGSFGTFTTAAIINQPQVAVLSTDGISRRPVVVADNYGSESIAIHSVGNLAMGWDHRAFDGGYAGGFLRRVKEILETRDWAAEL
ncbi:MAG: dihydrolipoamide acetyltransferase family protein [Actinomycetota bacterium]|nr:dihydrolipoamide acetyltransferase family protein [Actinomycetota bacterium]